MCEYSTDSLFSCKFNRNVYAVNHIEMCLCVELQRCASLCYRVVFFFFLVVLSSFFFYCIINVPRGWAKYVITVKKSELTIGGNRCDMFEHICSNRSMCYWNAASLCVAHKFFSICSVDDTSSIFDFYICKRSTYVRRATQCESIFEVTSTFRIQNFCTYADGALIQIQK